MGQPAARGKHLDREDWRAYNEQLVVRGEFLLSFEELDGWNHELRSMNRRKRGRPFRFPDSLFRFLTVIHQWIDYRALEGFCRSLAGLGLIPTYPDCATISVG